MKVIVVINAELLKPLTNFDCVVLVGKAYTDHSNVIFFSLTNRESNHLTVIKCCKCGKMIDNL